MIVAICKIHTKKINIKDKAHYDYENLIEPKKLETRNILIDKKSYKDLEIYFTRYHPIKLVTRLNFCYDKLIGKIVEYEGKTHLVVDDYILDKLQD